MRISPELEIDEAHLEERFVRASGPGGQNVNKVSTAVELRFDLSADTVIPPHARTKLKHLAGRRLTTEGFIVIQADRFRSQEQNRADARARLKEMIEESLVRPKPRVKTRPSRSARQERMNTKTSRGQVKKLRSRRIDQD